MYHEFDLEKYICVYSKWTSAQRHFIYFRSVWEMPIQKSSSHVHTYLTTGLCTRLNGVVRQLFIDFEEALDSVMSHAKALSK
jgi:hypothetical protein